MQKRALCVALCLALSVSQMTYVHAAESTVELITSNPISPYTITALKTSVPFQDADKVLQTDVVPMELPVVEDVEESVTIYVDDVALDDNILMETEYGTTYVSYAPVMQALYPDAVASWEGDNAVGHGTGLDLTICVNSTYLEVNGRYLWLEDGFKLVDDTVLVPIRVLANALGAAVTWDEESNSIFIRSNTHSISPDNLYYQEDVVYWLSRIIHAESGNQSLIGQIAVGNVVLNRVSSSLFPDTVYEVIFQSNQFTPAKNGTVYNAPSEQSIMAAKLCLSGANTAGEALYFVNPNISPNSWAARNRPYVETIGAHAFFA